MANVLLFEIMVTDGFMGAQTFAFMKGWLEEQQQKVLWLRFGVAKDPYLQHADVGISLTADERRNGANIVHEQEISHVIFNHRPGALLIETLTLAVPTIKLAILDNGSSSQPATRPLVTLHEHSLSELAGFLDLPISAKYASHTLLDHATPSYRVDLANPLAKQSGTLVYLIGLYAGCYRCCPLAQSQFFAKRAWATFSYGCTFCLSSHKSHDSRWRKVDQVSEWNLLEKQLKAVAHDVSIAPNSSLTYRLLSTLWAMDPLRLAQVVNEHAQPYGDFLIDLRADDVVRLQDELQKAVEHLKLSRKNHRLAICLIGIESFSKTQLDRFGKGYDPEINVECVRILCTLEQAAPKAFGFRKYGGLSTILFDPWSTLDEIQTTLHMVYILGIQQYCGKLLKSRLRLMPDLPLTRAAYQCCI